MIGFNVMIVDAHAHVFPDALEKFLPKFAQGPLGVFRSQARFWLRPFSSTLHRLQPEVRHLPEGMRRGVDELSSLLPVPGLLFESTGPDLKSAMDQARIAHALIIAHPPHSPNEFVLAAARRDPSLIPVVNLPPGTAGAVETLRAYVEQGARALKIHTPADGESVASPHYRQLLEAASELKIPVILHTGCFHTHLWYKRPELGGAEQFIGWFKAFSNIRFLLAHMNFHEPSVALDIATDHPNVVVDTSWQPAETVGEAVRRIGAERVLFATDWPFMGQNLQVGLDRVRTCVKTGLITEEQSRLVLGANAAKLFGIASDAG